MRGCRGGLDQAQTAVRSAREAMWVLYEETHYSHKLLNIIDKNSGYGTAYQQIYQLLAALGLSSSGLWKAWGARRR
jgi:hypothetical protein